MRNGIDLVPHKDKDGPCWIGNRAHFIGKPIKPEGSLDRIQRYYDAVDGRSSYFLQQNDNQPADAARHMLHYTSGFCVKRKGTMPGSNKEIWCGDCPDCIKNLGFECPVATKVRALAGFFTKNLCELMLTQAEPLEQSNRPQDAIGLRGLGPSKKSKRQKNPGKWEDDAKRFWHSYKDRSDKQFANICAHFGIMAGEREGRAEKRMFE